MTCICGEEHDPGNAAVSARILGLCLWLDPGQDLPLEVRCAPEARYSEDGRGVMLLQKFPDGRLWLNPLANLGGLGGVASDSIAFSDSVVAHFQILEVGKVGDFASLVGPWFDVSDLQTKESEDA